MLIAFLIFIASLSDVIIVNISGIAISRNNAVKDEIHIPYISDDEGASFTFCSRTRRINCIVDGDTFWYQGRKIRIADIDTAEIFRPKCDAEKRLGLRAKRRLFEILNRGAFSMQMVTRDKDYFGRDLRIIMRRGNSIGDILIAEGLAYTWRGRKESWC